jgi:multiple sugar transport system substrate-binding protein
VFVPASVLAYAEWPKGTPNYWGLPAMADAVGWTYRKDWFAKPELRAEFKAKYNRELEPPKTWDELLEVSKFFTGKEIDGKKVYGSYIFTERGSEGITMGVTNAMYNYGFDYMDPKEPYHMEGFVNSAGAAKGMDVYKELFDCCQPPGLTNAYMQEGLDAFKSGQVAMQMNWYAFFPGLSKDPNVGGDKIGFFVNPAGPAGRWTQLGGQGLSVVAASKDIEDSLLYVKWFAQPAVQQKWTDLGGASASVAVLESDAFKKSADYAPSFVESMDIMKDFWAEPLYIPLLLDMQNRVHDYVVANKGTSQQALDALVKDWKKVFKQEGKNPS